MDSSFTYIKHKDIDIAKWDKLVDSSDNALIFCYSWYINGFCSWDAIILRDYDGAIALPTKRKFGVKTLFQPNFIQKCVWFGEVLSGEDEIAVWKIIQNNFHQVNFNCNIRLAKTSSQRVNQILPLTIYDSIQLGYSKSLTKNINKHASSLLVKERLSVKNTIGLYKVAYGDLNKQLTAASYNSLEELSVSHPESFLNIHILFESKIIGSLLFAVGKNRLHYILGAPTKEGRSKGELDTHHQKKKARDQFTVAALLMHDNIVKKIRSELKKVSDGVILTDEEIRNTLQKDVIKQTILAGDEAKKAKTFVTRKLNQSEKKRQQKKSASKTQVEKLDIEPSVPVAPPVQATETTTVTESPQGTGV